MHTAFSEHLLTLFSRHFHLAVALAVASASLLPLPRCRRRCHPIMSSSTQLSAPIDGTEYAFWVNVRQALDNWAIKDKFSFLVVKKEPTRAIYCCRNKGCSWRCQVQKNKNEMLILTIVKKKHICIETELKKRKTASDHVWLNETVFKHLNIIKTTDSKAIVKCIHIHYSKKISYKIAQLTHLCLLSEGLSNQWYSFQLLSSYKRALKCVQSNVYMNIAIDELTGKSLSC